MPFSGVTMVRDEADVIEAFVRHNLQFLERIYIVDHRSRDGTRDILQALAAEGLPITVEHDEGEAHRQSETITRLARRAFANGATGVFPLDADEFLKVPSRVALKRFVASIPSPWCGAMEWQTYIVDPAQPTTNPLAAARFRRAREAHGLYKVILTPAFARNPIAVVGPGNHSVLMKGAEQDLARDPSQLALVPPNIVALAHLPVRSLSQLQRKIRNGWRAHAATGTKDATLAFHWRELNDEFAGGAAVTPERFRQIACNYGVPMERWVPPASVALVEDPVHTPPLRGLRPGAASPAAPAGG